MKWLRKSKYHEESDPPRFYLAAVKVIGAWRFTLTDRAELVGCFDTADKAKAEAERHDQDRNAAAA